MTSQKISAEFTIDIGRTKGRISKLWFGHNLEHTRSCMWRGLCAQLIRNRKFAGKPHQLMGQAAEWYPIGPSQTYFLLDSSDNSWILPDDRNVYTRHYNTDQRRRRHELNCQRIQAYVNGERCGIGQDRLPLFAGREYEVRLVLRSSEGMSVSASFLSHDGKKTYFETTIEVLPNDWHSYVAVFAAPDTDPEARMEITFNRMGELAIGAVSLLPKYNFHGMRTDVVELLKEIGTPILRWPGGNFAGDYRWQDGLLDIDERGPLNSFMEIETLPHTFGFDFHEVGTDEYIALCQEIGAEPFISINLAWETPEESAAWVEYCNGSPDMKWGKVRAERGHPESYNVKYWSLGNEMGYGHMEGPNDPGAYAKKAKACAEGMKRVDPSITLVTSGAWSKEEWFSDCLGPLASHVDYISHHEYAPFMTHYTGEKSKEDFKNLVTVPTQRTIKEMKDIRNKINTCVREDRFIGISFDEWNCWYAWYRTPGVAEGIYAASMLNLFCREALDVGMTIGCYFEPVNEGAVIVDPGGSRLTPVGQAFSLFKAHHGNITINLAPQDPEGLVDAAASIDEDSGDLVVTLVNRNSDESCKVKLSIVGAKKVALSEGFLLRSDDFLPASVFDEAEADTTVIDDNTVDATLPKHSIARLRFSCG